LNRHSSQRHPGLVNISRLTVTLLFPVLLGTGVSAHAATKIVFDANGCPQPPVADISTSRGKKIEWQAYDQAGAPSRQSFEIFFDPIKGSPLKGNSGNLKRNIDQGAPKVEYKYTIVGKGCEHSPLDPNIRVN